MFPCCSWSVCGFTVSYTDQLLILGFATSATRQSCCDVRSMCEWVQDKSLFLAFHRVSKYKEKKLGSLSPMYSCSLPMRIPEHCATFRLPECIFWPLLPLHAPTESTDSVSTSWDDPKPLFLKEIAFLQTLFTCFFAEAQL